MALNDDFVIHTTKHLEYMASAFNLTIAWSKHTGQDVYNKPTYDAAVDIPGRVFDKIVSTTTVEGTMEKVQTEVWLKTDGTVIKREDKLVLPDATERPIAQLGFSPSAGNPQFTRATLQ